VRVEIHIRTIHNGLSKETQIRTIYTSDIQKWGRKQKFAQLCMHPKHDEQAENFFFSFYSMFAVGKD